MHDPSSGGVSDLGASYFPPKNNDRNFVRVAEVLQHSVSSGFEAFSAAWSGRLFRPLVMDAAAYNSLNDRLGLLADLIESLPERFFDGDICALGEALGMDSAPLEILRLIGRPLPIRSLRADVVVHAGGASVVELNWGSRLGGYDIDCLAPAASAALMASSPSGTVYEMSPTPTESLVTAIHDQLPFGVNLADVQALIVCGGEVHREAPMMRSIAEHLSRWLPEVRLISLDELPGQLPKLTRGRFPVVLRYFQVDDLTTDERLTSAVSTLYELDRMGKLLLWTGLEGAVFASKGLLSLLYNLASSDRLAENEKRLVLELVAPSWDARVLPESWASASEVIGLPIEEVLFKPKRGIAGDGIVLGREIDPKDQDIFWENARDKDVVVQRLFDPIQVAYALPGEDEGAWRVVLGVYRTPLGAGGIVVRARPWQDDSAVVSASSSTRSRVGTVLVPRPRGKSEERKAADALREL